MNLYAILIGVITVGGGALFSFFKIRRLQNTVDDLQSGLLHAEERINGYRIALNRAREDHIIAVEALQEQLRITEEKITAVKNHAQKKQNMSDDEMIDILNKGGKQ